MSFGIFHRVDEVLFGWLKSVSKYAIDGDDFTLGIECKRYVLCLFSFPRDWLVES